MRAGAAISIGVACAVTHQTAGHDSISLHQSPGSPSMTYAHSASISSGSSTSSHGGILRFPLVTESTKRAWALRGKSRRLIVEMIAHPEGGDVFAVLAVVDQFPRGLSQRAAAPGRQ